MGALRLVGFSLLICAARPAAADDVVHGGWVAEGAQPIPVDMPIWGTDTHGRTRFHVITRFTPASAAHLWSFEPRASLRAFPGLAVTFGVPMAILAPQADGSDDRFSLGNIHLGVTGGTGIPLARAGDSDVPPLSLRIGGAVDIYAPTAPLPEDDGPTALAAQHFQVLEPGLWASRAFGARFRMAVGLDAAWWGVAAELGITPSFDIDGADVAPSVWVTPLLRAHAVLLQTFEPFVELGATITAAEPDGTVADTGGFQISPGIRFHVLGLSPALFVSIQPGHDSGNVTVAIDLAGAVKRAARSRDDPLERLPPKAPADL